MSDYSLAEMQSYYAELIDLIRRGVPTSAPDVMRLPVKEYTDRERWDQEVQLFRELPLLIALSTELAERGSYWAMTMLGVPILLTRLKDGSVRMFINACRHRGAKLAADGQGTASRLTCIYHAWSYGLDGQLLSIAERNIFGDVDKECLGLKELAVEERHGLIWGVLTPGIALDLDTFLGAEINAMIQKSHLEHFRTVSRVELDGANWKLVAEGYRETYHLASLHGATFTTFVYPHIMKLDSYGLHERHITPAVGIMECDPNSITELNRFVQITYALFPNILLAFASDTGFSNNIDKDRKLIKRIFANQVLPGDSPEKSITISRTLVSEDVRGTDREEEIDIWSNLSMDVLRKEDYPVVQSVQSTLHSGANDFFTFGKNEISVHNFHKSLHDLLAKRTTSVSLDSVE